MPRFHPLTLFCFNLVRLILITWPAHLIKNIYIIKRQDKVEEILYFGIWDSQLHRLLWIHRLNPEEEKSKQAAPELRLSALNEEVLCAID